jgi:NitT/TauT family transport system substrate-binding protein
VFGPSLLKERPEVEQRFMNALVRASRDLQGPSLKSDENLAIFSKHVRIPVETLKTMDPYDYEPTLKPDAATLTDMQQVFITEGLLRFASPIPAERYVDETFSNNAR